MFDIRSPPLPGEHKQSRRFKDAQLGHEVGWRLGTSSATATSSTVHAESNGAGG